MEARAARQNTLHEFDERIRTLQTAHDFNSHEVIRLKRERNGYTTFVAHHIPDEILAGIMLYVQSVNHCFYAQWEPEWRTRWLAISQTCTRLREVAIACSELWVNTQIGGRICLHEDFTELCIQRARGKALNLLILAYVTVGSHDYLIRNDAVTRFLSAMNTYVHRASSIRILYRDDLDPHEYMMSSLQQLLDYGGSLPGLHRLECVFPDPPCNEIGNLCDYSLYLTSASLGGSSASLTYLFLSGVVLLNGSPSFPALRHLHLNAMIFSPQFGGLRALLEASPGLIEVTIRQIDIDYSVCIEEHPGDEEFDEDLNQIVTERPYDIDSVVDLPSLSEVAISENFETMEGLLRAIPKPRTSLCLTEMREYGYRQNSLNTTSDTYVWERVVDFCSHLEDSLVDHLMNIYYHDTEGIIRVNIKPEHAPMPPNLSRLEVDMACDLPVQVLQAVAKFMPSVNCAAIGIMDIPDMLGSSHLSKLEWNSWAYVAWSTAADRPTQWMDSDVIVDNDTRRSNLAKLEDILMKRAESGNPIKIMTSRLWTNADRAEADTLRKRWIAEGWVGEVVWIDMQQQTSILYESSGCAQKLLRAQKEEAFAENVPR